MGVDILFWGGVSGGGGGLSHQNGTCHPIAFKRQRCGRIITSIPVIGVTFPLMHWGETGNDVRRRVGEMGRQERHERLDYQKQLIKSLFVLLCSHTIS